MEEDYKWEKYIDRHRCKYRLQEGACSLMLTIIVEVDRPAGQAIGVKEDLAMYLERWGDARVVSVEQRPQPQMEQMTIGGKGYAERDMSRMRR